MARQATLFDESFYAPPIDEVVDDTADTRRCVGPVYRFWASDKDTECLAHGIVTEDIRAMASSMLKWKQHYWQGTDAEAAYALYLELVSYGLKPYLTESSFTNQQRDDS